MFLYFNRNSLSTGELITFLDIKYSGFAEYMTICYWLDNTENNVTFIIRTVEHYREYFRIKSPEYWNNFELSLTSQGHTLEDHLTSLPSQLQHDLRVLGFVALGTKEV
jgi:hypothetical protein